MDNNKIEWIALDWGTTHFRAWALAHNGEILDKTKSDKGMGTLKREEFEPTLLAEIAGWLEGKAEPVSAFACGMVGAKQGWQDAGYISVPAPPPRGDELLRVKTGDPRLQIYIVPGMAQAEPADVMRGEETQIAGFLANMPHFTGAICLPGTHSKWVLVEAGMLKSFSTFMTGELFSLLSHQSVLKHSVASDGWDQQAFLNGVECTMECPEMLGKELFGIRPKTLLHDASQEAGKSRLSGLLLGAELNATRSLWQSGHLCIIGDPKLCDLYSGALELFDCHATHADGDMMTLAGLHAVAAQMLKNLR